MARRIRATRTAAAINLCDAPIRATKKVTSNGNTSHVIDGSQVMRKTGSVVPRRGSRWRRWL